MDATREEERVPTWDDPAAYGRAVMRSYRRNKWEAQPVHVAVWSEKSTVEGALRPVLEEYEVPEPRHEGHDLGMHAWGVVLDVARDWASSF